jgi:hypothetical protein
MFWLGFTTGLFAGMFFTLFVMALCAAASESDSHKKE